MEDYRVDEKGNDLELYINCLDVVAVRELLSMAINDVAPNGDYSDYEVAVYEAMRRVLRWNNVIK